MNVVELFSGIGAQAKALENTNIEHKIIATCDWDLNAIIAYDLIHNGPQELDKYSEMSDNELNEYILNLSLSGDGKKPLSYSSKLTLNREIKIRLVAAIERSNNKVDITTVKGVDLPDDIDVMTYSFPCQDLSLAGNWHKNQGGIDRDANNRSSLLWQVERILFERVENNMPLPKALLMENVTAISSPRHINNFLEWQSNLNDLGYVNKVLELNSYDFGLPQKRLRTFMISIYVGENQKYKDYVNEQFGSISNDNFHEIFSRDRIFMSDILRTDYNNKVLLLEALESNPNDTVSRKDIYEKCLHVNANTKFVPTVTTKQDRFPNSGVIDFEIGKEGKSKFRYLTPRECFMLMGFDEKDFENVVNYNFTTRGNVKFFTRDKLNRMAGNSICVNVLETIFTFLNEVLI